MTVQELINILSNKKEVPYPDKSEICFYFIDGNGEESFDLKIKSIGAFSISTDVTMGFVKEDYEK